MKNTPVIPSSANVVLQHFLAGLTNLNSTCIKGIYVTGSIALQDFQAAKSDIDFLVLCNELPDNNLQAKLKTLHSTIEQKFNKANLSGIYLTPDSLHLQQAHTANVLSFHEGRMQVSAFGMAAVTLYELKTTAITLQGIPAQLLPITVPIDDVTGFLFENINSYWKTWLTKHSRPGSRHIFLILFPRLTEWVVLGLARQLYTLRTGAITSKTAAGYYCLQHLPATYHPIIRKAIAIRNDTRKHTLTFKASYSVQPSIKRAVETLACAKYIIDMFNTEYTDKKNSRC